ncbi:hypothetical protein [Rhizobium brockwellii]|uniref:hypothetical protein n=1 Tax=Rhizobium brockwellii TaxID=3019932 RepID=UPI0038734398
MRRPDLPLGRRTDHGTRWNERFLERVLHRKFRSGSHSRMVICHACNLARVSPALFATTWMCLAAISAGIYGTWKRTEAIAAFHADKVIQHSFFVSLHQVPREVAARLLSGAALNAALWIAASENPQSVLPKAVESFQTLAAGLLVEPL